MIIVNATALRTGGALTILSQFIDSAMHSKKYLIFVHPSVNFQVQENIKLVKLNKVSIMSRILWDFCGLSTYLEKNKIKAEAIISLQNTSIKTSQKCKQIIYIHNVIPFSDYKFSLFKKSDLKLLLYKYFYAFFIFLYATKSTQYVVQSNWLKAILVEGGIEPDNILVARPSIITPELADIRLIDLDNEKINAFYPASNFEYKNHVEIINALIYMKDNGMQFEHIKIYFTLDKLESSKLYELIRQHDLTGNFAFLGALPFEEVLRYYKSVDLVLFPSRLETFGLPLIEAASFGKYIVTIDLEYAKEVLNGYSTVVFCPEANSECWARSILSVQKNLSVEPFQYKANDWSMVHKQINK